MYPSSKNYLHKAGFSASAGGWIILGCFVTGFIGIQVLSRFLHHYIPSHVVDCDHTHEDGPSEGLDHQYSRSNSHGGRSRRQSQSVGQQPSINGTPSELSPLLNGDHGLDGASHSKSQRKASPSNNAVEEDGLHPSYRTRRPSMVQVQKRVMSFVKDTKSNCDDGGPCFGYSDPCGRECFKHVGSRTNSRQPSLVRPVIGWSHRKGSTFPDISEENGVASDGETALIAASTRLSRTQSRDSANHECGSSDEEDVETQHHHHVPENPFLSIGLQTSIAIALHKLPEGFITYATNHANPALGFTVFMALFIHNITEGFAMALPLYLALGSRAQAMFWSSLLGGISQPLGAGIAALWFKLAQNTDHVPGFAVYGCMFGITAGIMTSVAIQLFVESMSLNHNSNLVTASALVGMAIMGISSALTAE
jgi:ZIP family zinc transporter